jgi:hypothetical protein
LARQGSVGAGETRPAGTARPAVTSIAGQPGVTAGATVTAGAAARPSDTARAAVAGRAFLATSAVTARTASAAPDDDVTGTDGTDRRGAARDRTITGGQCRAPGRVDNDAGSTCATDPTDPAVAARRADRGKRIGGSVVAVPSPPTGASRTDVTGPAIKSCDCCRSACGTALAARTRSRPGGTAGATGAPVRSRRSAVATCAPVACRPGVSARASVAAVTSNTGLCEEKK